MELTRTTPLSEAFPEIAAQWHPYRNKDVTPSDVTHGSHKKYWWLDHGHEWEATIASRTRLDAQCGVCYGSKVSPGFNDLSTLNPFLALQWDYEKNYPLIPEQVRGGTSNKQYWWKCHDCSYSCERSVSNRVKTPRCVACTRSVVVPGVNDLATTHPEIAAEWHPTLNGSLTPQDIMAGHNKNIFWEAHGHYWPAKPNSRTGRGDGCSVCANRYLNKGVNDLATTHPEIAAEWDYARNGDLTPDSIISGNGIEVFWTAHGHYWEASIYNRKSGGGCQVCVGKYVNVGVNDLATTHPHLVEEWDDSLENNIPLTEITRGNRTHSLGWRCSKGHRWQALAKDRAREGVGTGCPECARTNFSSRGENDLADFAASLGFTIERNNRSLIGSELDIYIPEKRIAIEFNGLYYHSEQFVPHARHQTKTQMCEEAGIRLIHIWEDDWADRRDIVQRMLCNALGVSDERKVGARQTTVCIVNYQEASDFLTKHHIQGESSGSRYYGLRDQAGTLVAIMVLKRSKSEGHWTLERYATSCSVLGGHSKLLEHFKKDNPTWSRIVTFADLSYSNGDLYRKTGWTADTTLPPDYKYIVNNRREHKFNYRLKRFRNDPSLQYVGGYTERQLADLNGLDRIWDCGKIRFVVDK